MSGGQRLLIGIARALYANSEIVVLDDPFSALDEVTRVNLRNFLARYIVAEEKRNLVLATHAVHLLKSDVREILVLKQGVVVERGTYEVLLRTGSVFPLLLENESQKSVTNEKKIALEGEMEKNLEEIEREDIETKKSGRIDSTVYWSYFSSCGLLITFLTFISTFLMQFSNLFMSIWLGYWATHEENYNDKEFIRISAIIVGFCLLFTFSRSFLFAYGALKAAKNFYQNFVISVMKTDIQFFERTSIGEIENRFEKDTSAIDDSLPFILNILLAQTFLMIGSLFMMFNGIISFFALILVISLYYRIQNFYRITSRELRRLDSLYRSPLYTLYSECLSGAVELRSLGLKSLSHMFQNLQKTLNVFNGQL